MLCLLTVGGCSRAPAHRAADPLPVPLDGAAAVPVEQAVVLHRAEERAIASCMRRRGFSYRAVPAARPVSENPYGLLTEETAAADGYGLTSAALAARPADPNASALAKLDKAGRSAWQEALIGTGKHRVTLTAPGTPSLRVNTDGCVYLARRDVYGKDWEQAETDVAGVNAQVVSGVAADPGFRAAQRTWAVCMRDGHWSVNTLQEARGLIQEAVARARGDRSALVRAGRREQSLARDDAHCQNRSELAAATRRAQARVESRLPKSSRDRAALLNELRSRALHDGAGSRRQPVPNGEG